MSKRSFATIDESTAARLIDAAISDDVGKGKVRVAGVAWALHTGVAKVEVRVDQGPWQEAMLSHEVNLDTWRMWWAEVDLLAGVHQVFCRATDKSGYT